MPMHRPAHTSISALARLVPPGGFVLVETECRESPAGTALRDLAADVAVAARGRVLLYDGSSAPPWSGDARIGRRMLPGAAGRVLRSWELEALGRAHLLPQIGACMSRGAHALAWLASAPGSGGIEAAVEGAGASLVLLRTEPESPPADPRVLRLTAPWYASRISVPVVVLEEGSPRLVEPLVSPSHRPGHRRVAVPAAAAAIP